MYFASTKGGAAVPGFPDVCYVPGGPAPVPVPYPNVGTASVSKVTDS
jgi:hypothetical protein